MSDDRVVERRTKRTSDNARELPAPRESFYRHLIAAANRLAERAREAENTAVVQGPGRALASVVSHRSDVVGAIFCATSFLEGSINELYSELHGVRGRGTASLPRHVLSVLNRLWSDIERAPVLHRYQVVLMVADAERFDERSAPFYDAVTLLRVRDALVHCGPERAGSRRRLRTLEERLRDRFEPNPFAASTAPWFPHILLGADCADWAVRSANVFSDAFCRRLALPVRGLVLTDSPPIPAKPLRGRTTLFDESAPGDIPLIP